MRDKELNFYNVMDSLDEDVTKVQIQDLIEYTCWWFEMTKPSNGHVVPLNLEAYFVHQICVACPC